MKYKFELWPYGAFDTDEAEKHLNDMAAKGYRLVTMGETYIEYACYVKDENARSLIYALDLNPEIQEEPLQDYYGFYKDMGWELLKHNPKSGLCIFTTNDKGRAKPLYADEEYRLESFQASIEKNDWKDMVWVNLICTCLIFACIIYATYNDQLRNAVVFCGPLLCSLFLVNEVANQFYLKDACKANSIEEVVPRPKWIASYERCVFYTIVLASLGIWGYGTWIILKQPETFSFGGDVLNVLLMAATITAPITIPAGFFYNSIMEKPVGWFLIIAGAIGLIVVLASILLP